MPDKGRSEVDIRKVRMWAEKGARYQCLVTIINDPVAMNGNITKGHGLEGDGETN